MRLAPADLGVLAAGSSTVAGTRSWLLGLPAAALVVLALGADGAPCNNRLCALDEARSAARLQAMAVGPGRWPAALALHAQDIPARRCITCHPAFHPEMNRSAHAFLLDEGEMNVGQLVVELGTSQANVSKHLRILHDARIVTRRAEGTAAYYSVTDPSLMPVCAIVCDRLRDQAASDARTFAVT